MFLNRSTLRYFSASLYVWTFAIGGYAFVAISGPSDDITNVEADINKLGQLLERKS